MNTESSHITEAHPPVLHIGYPKCASTYLQQLIFPELGNVTNLSAAPWDEKCYLLMSDMNPQRYRRLIENRRTCVRSDRPHSIISCEAFVQFLFRGFEDHFARNLRRHGVDPDRCLRDNADIAARLKAEHPGARILIVIREPVQWALSRYKMHYRAGQTSSTFAEFTREPLEDYDGMEQRYRELFGPPQVRVIPFELLREDASAFVDQVTSFIAPGIELAAPQRKLNAAPPLRRTVETGREKARVKAEWEPCKCRSLRARLRHRLARWKVSTQVRFKNFLRYGDQPFDIEVDEACAARIRDAFAPGLRRLCERTGLDLERYGYRTGPRREGRRP
ncbi:sulfotransferase [Kiritimatiella glycovorans]|uniref:Sulfotransferase domain protein n=1 Tax=Kiritimatiella glycovorans TaxID=1307763 RepID=A0A0G3EI13_9BACT|nr:sulfotransferase [Kiritimatiella glycovorans]AKJ64450.1 hypothetical protein L21SP4_01202 [Kiritimatiella glycovorans]